MNAQRSRLPRATSLDEVLANHRILVCLGTGGVGKTTIAAALGLGSASDGDSTLVMTFDPSLLTGPMPSVQAPRLGAEDEAPVGLADLIAQNIDE